MRYRSILVLALAAALMAPQSVTAHDPESFTVLLFEEGPVPGSIAEGTLFENDSLFFRNQDTRENATHRIQIDADGDGVFGGVDDMSTQWLASSCELNETGHKVDEECQAAEVVLLSASNGLLPGNISMMHQIDANGELIERLFYVNFALDVHTTPSDGLPTGDERRLCCADNGPVVLLLLASLIGIAIILPKLMGSTEDE